jgi:lipopolysaccharide transport system ATP-binding protein
LSTASIQVEHVSKQYLLGSELQNRTLADVARNLLRRARGQQAQAARQPFLALNDVSMRVEQGEIVGIVGHNGSGKSTLLKIISRITAPTTGRVTLRGRVGSLLEVGTGFHPEMTGRENIYVNGSILGMTQAEIERQFDDIVAFADIGGFLDTPVKRYSSGMYVRLAFAVAAHLQPEILLVDEVLAVGDANFQKKCLGKMADIGAGGRTVVFVSHNLQAIMRLCSRAFLLDHGRLIAEGDPQTVINTYLGFDSGGIAERHYAPTDPLQSSAVRLHSVRLCNSAGATASEFEIQDDIFVEFRYEVLQDNRQVSPGIVLTDAEGILLFRSHAADEAAHQPLARGLYTSRVRIPGNFLNEGSLVVTGSLVSYLPSFSVHVRIQDGLTLRVYDRGLEGGARGLYVGTMVGVIRPLLEWTTEPAT